MKKSVYGLNKNRQIGKKNKTNQNKTIFGNLVYYTFKYKYISI